MWHAIAYLMSLWHLMPQVGGYHPHLTIWSR